MASLPFKLGMFINELRLPLPEALDVAADLGVDYVWFSSLLDRPPVAELTDTELDEIDGMVRARGLQHMIVSAGAPFKHIDLVALEADSLAADEAFARDLAELVRSMEIANRWGVGAVSAYSFAWPGEYTAGKPTWPMRWATRGGVIADVEMDKLAAAYGLVVAAAEKQDVDVVLSMMPWNYTNTTGNFRRVAERVGSDRIKVMWGPADNLNCGESDVATAGFRNISPWVHSLHPKDLRVNDGAKLDFDYLPFGEGQTDYATVCRNLLVAKLDSIVSISTHWAPPSGSAVEAMTTQVGNVKALIGSLEPPPAPR